MTDKEVKVKNVAKTDSELARFWQESSLDNITQQKITEALESLNCTRIVVAQRLSTIQKCNRILVINNGKIAEEGTYSDLIEKNGIFKGLVEGQEV